MNYKILIVDDQKDVRRVLASGLQTLGQPIEVLEVPSAEEAMLIAPRRKFDLIVTDVKLAGMSGLDLVRWLKKRNPEIKLILMTGAEDRQTRRQVEEAGALAFFYKPIEMSDFLDAVERALGLVPTNFGPPPLEFKPVPEKPPQPAKPEASDKDVPTQPLKPLLPALAALAAEPGVRSAALLKVSGELVSQAGEPGGLVSNAALLPVLLAAAHANQQLSDSLARSVPDYSLFLDGASFSIGLAPVGKDHLLLVVGSQSLKSVMVRAGSAMHSAAGGLLQYLAEQKARQQPAAPVETAPAAVEPALAAADSPTTALVETAPDEDLLAALAHVEVSAEDRTAIDNLFGDSSSKRESVKNLDDFWETAVEEAGSMSMDESHISYDEARDLGLAPE